jgi:hypothetical protein
LLLSHAVPVPTHQFQVFYGFRHSSAAQFSLGEGDLEGS